MLCWATTSRPIVGSSRNSTSGECNSAAISSIFIRSPSDNSRTGWPSSRLTCSRSTSSSRGRSNWSASMPIDLLVQAKRLLGGQIPPELVLLAHHQREPAAIGVLALPGHEAHHAGGAAGGIDDAGEQLERGGFAGAVGAEKGDELALSTRRSMPPTAAPRDTNDGTVRERWPAGLPASGKRGRTSRARQFR